ncbi:BolA family transcriptional regulator [Gammaproteobacteria bacterium]|nr:BolA family transcriptional regulator [Gammaproteobacteria bacterium]
MSAHETIVSQLNLSFDVENLFLENESFMHNVPLNSETHFKLIIVSNDFTDLTNVKRHQCIYKALNDTMTRIHALSIQAFTLDEYLKNPIILESPDCANK